MNELGQKILASLGGIESLKASLNGYVMQYAKNDLVIHFNVEVEDKINCVKIVQETETTYHVEFWQLYRDTHFLEEIEDVTLDQLKSTIEARLGTLINVSANAIKKNTIISSLILGTIARGSTVEEAIDLVLGKGTYQQIAGEIYDALSIKGKQS